MNGGLKTYKQRQVGLLSSLLIFLAFIFQNIYVLVTKHELVPEMLSTFSLVVFLILATLCVNQVIYNYRHRP